MKFSNKNIAETVEKIEKFFESANVSHKDKIKICLLLEEFLLRYQEKFGENYNFELVTRKWFGTPKIMIKIVGTPYNPIENNSEENIFSENIMENLLNYERAGLIYSYENGCNEITAATNKIIKNLKIPGSSIILFVLLSIISALILKNFPQEIQNIIVSEILNSILNTLLGTIIAVSIPLIFISIVASICSIEDIAMLNELGIKILLRFLAIMFFTVFVPIFICEMFFPVISLDFEKNFLSDNLFEFKQLFNLILSMFPQDIFMAFTEKNILQIKVMAWLIGFCITILSNKVSELKNFVLNVRQFIYKFQR